MIYRKLDENGDMVRGQGKQDYLSGVEAVAQACMTRLQLYKGEFWRDINDGIPMFQEILGRPASPDNLSAIDSLIQTRISGTQGVTGIVSYTSQYDHLARAYSFQAQIQTIYSVTVITGVI